MQTRNDIRLRASAFTLIELILVMAILSTILALSAPLLARSFGARGLEDDATQWFALTEYARDEAISQGVPMTLWVNPQTGGFGVHAKEGFEGDLSREKTYWLRAENRFDLADAPTDRTGVAIAAEFDPSGTLSDESLWEVAIVDRSDSRIAIAQKDEGGSYEIVKP